MQWKLIIVRRKYVQFSIKQKYLLYFIRACVKSVLRTWYNKQFYLVEKCIYFITQKEMLFFPFLFPIGIPMVLNRRERGKYLFSYGR
jgi:hypothetical protein